MWEPDFTLLSEPVKVSPPAVPLQMAPPPPRSPSALLAAPPPKRCMTESESVTDVVRVARVPYAERPVVLPKPARPALSARGSDARDRRSARVFECYARNTPVSGANRRRVASRWAAECECAIVCHHDWVLQL